MSVVLSLTLSRATWARPEGFLMLRVLSGHSEHLCYEGRMKKISTFALVLLLTQTALAVTPDLGVYLRAGSGSNAAGGAQECISNRGSGGNEFRLGNECGIYGEFGIGATLLKAENERAPFWRLFTNFAFSYNNRTDWEGNNSNNWVLREVYTEGGRVDGLDFTAWAGKRFYRWGDVHMNDFYPVNFSGPGGGIGGLHVGKGVLSLAVIQNAQSDEINGSTGQVTRVGNAAKSTLHVRYEDLATGLGVLSLWGVVGSTPSTKTTATPETNYKAATGGFLALRLSSALRESTRNEWGVAYGQSLLSNMGSTGDLVKDCAGAADASCNVTGSWRVRAWDSVVYEGESWSVAGALMYDELNKGTAVDSRVRWTSVGVRPTYWITEHISLAGQAGISNVVDESDGLGARNLWRVTVAPQISMSKGYFARPVIRAYYSRTQWNENNKTSASGTSAAADTSIDTLGFQTEVWF